MTSRIIGFPGPPQPHGGPGSFQKRLTRALEERGWEIAYPKSGIRPDVILVIAGSPKLVWLWRCRRAGTRIVHRLDGFNWRHRYVGASWKHRFLASWRNFLVRLIRRHFADHVVYQSEFVKNRWYEVCGPAPCRETIIHNGIDLDEFCPKENAGGDRLPNLVCVEGSVEDSPAYLKPLEFLAQRLAELNLVNETLVCGAYAGDLSDEEEAVQKKRRIRFLGRLDRNDMPEIYRNALYLVLEVQPPCPNSVVESLASGAPVIGFDTGSLFELIGEEAGRVVPYGADAWKMEVPDFTALEPVAKAILSDFSTFSNAARSRAVERFGIDEMVSRYLEVLDPATEDARSLGKPGSD